MESDKFKQQFQKIVYANSEVVSSNNRIKQLSAWDKNGSHEKAIIKEIELRNKLKENLRKLLDGRSYDDWRLTSRQLTTLKGRLKRTTLQKDKIEKDIFVLMIEF